MSDGFTVVIPGPSPKLNSTYHVVTTGKRCPACGRGPARLAKKAGVEAWQTETSYRVRVAKPSSFIAVRVRVTIEWYNPRRADCDSGIKAALDAVAAGLGVDDADFLVTVARNEVDKAAPRTILSIANEEA